ncbi:unnamed protein product [Schistosoma margrebowiei]|uniref:Uncharacterized protein n=1 Tax=Schistosoma margrebowiei TaxID=48269 RepID=A0A183MI78_9TREM|nr:unnamed protein product [Schistosoma margrebowiei]
METSDQQQAHTLFLLSGFWSSLAKLVWNQGFPTPLGGLVVSTNPVKAPDIQFSFSQFRRQHLRHEKAVGLPRQWLYTLGRMRAFREGELTLPTLGCTMAFEDGISTEYYLQMRSQIQIYYKQEIM